MLNVQIFPKWIVAQLLISLAFATPSCAGADLQLDGFHCIQAKNYTQALVCFSSALKEHPNSWQILQSIGNCHSELGHYDTAISFFQKSIEVGGMHGSQCVNIAAVYQKLGDNKKALSWLKLACSVDPKEASDEYIQGTIRRLENPLSNPTGSPTSSDYVSSLLGVRRWPKSMMPIKVYVRPNPQLQEMQKIFSEVVTSSLDQWCKASGSAISYRIVDRVELANLICDYTDRPDLVRPDHDLGSEGAADTQVRLKDNTLEWADITCLVCDEPGAPPRDRAMLNKLCLHEIGHALGMRGHSPSNRDTMFFNSSVPTVSDKLTQRDKNTIRKIYQK